MRKRDSLFILAYFLNIINGIFLVLGLMLVAFGVWILLDVSHFFTLLLSTGEQHSVIASFPYMLLAIGSLIIFTGLLGYLGSLHGIRYLILLYVCLVALVFGLQAAILVLLYSGKETVFNLWKIQMDELISTYGNKDLPVKKQHWNILNCIQRMVPCCGRYNFSDWKKNKYKEHETQVPCSCTTSNMKKWFCDALENATYTKGCEQDTKVWFEKNTWLFISINAGLLSVEVLQFILAVWLFKIMRKNVVSPKN